VKLSSKLFRLYIAKKSEQTIGFGILLTQKVRSKSTAVLYMLTPDGNLKNIEIIAFNEPKEYLPSKRWIAQFKEKKTKEFVENSDLTMISGATLSANAIIKVANIARAIWKVKLNK
ncbi:MAG: FMN-binding protein, partial [Thiovulaceae bacterium]|nr:FMN-binding protein [Sulfurimonadaceae bacterium]